MYPRISFLQYQTSVCFGSQVALEGLRPTIPPGISPHICKLMKICMNEDPAKRPKFDMIVPILEKMQDKWKNPPLASCTEPLSSGISLCYGGVVLTSIALNSYSTAAFNATVASEMNSAAVTSFMFFFSMWYQVFISVFIVVIDLLMLSSQELNIDCSSSIL